MVTSVIRVRFYSAMHCERVHASSCKYDCAVDGRTAVIAYHDDPNQQQVLQGWLEIDSNPLVSAAVEHARTFEVSNRQGTQLPHSGSG